MSADGESGAQRRASDLPLPGGDFRLFVTRLSFQALLSLGLLENPVTGTRQVNLDQARMLIADLRMLRRITVGNLEADEQAFLDKVIADLQHHEQRIAGAHAP